jgi:hypothetical protein
LPKIVSPAWHEIAVCPCYLFASALASGKDFNSVADDGAALARGAENGEAFGGGAENGGAFGRGAENGETFGGVGDDGVGGDGWNPCAESSDVNKFFFFIIFCRQASPKSAVP